MFKLSTFFLLTALSLSTAVNAAPIPFKARTNPTPCTDKSSLQLLPTPLGESDGQGDKYVTPDGQISYGGNNNGTSNGNDNSNNNNNNNSNNNGNGMNGSNGNGSQTNDGNGNGNGNGNNGQTNDQNGNQNQEGQNGNSQNGQNQNQNQNQDQNGQNGQNGQSGNQNQNDQNQNQSGNQDQDQNQNGQNGNQTETGQQGQNGQNGNNNNGQQGQNGLSANFRDLAKPIHAPYYVYFGNEDTPSLSSAFDKLGMRAATIAFGSSPRGKCELTADMDGMIPDVEAFIAKGGAVALSFGGNLRDQTVPRQHIQQACQDEGSLADLIRGAITKFHTENLEFDIEDPELVDDLSTAQRLAKAIKLVKQTNPNLFVVYTLSTGTQGLPNGQKAYMKAAKDAGVQVDVLSLMTMNMGTKDNVQGSQTAIAGGAKQYAEVFGISLDTAVQHMGMIPAIGVDDTQVILNIEGAKTLATFAKQNQMAIMSYWDFNRDFPFGRLSPQELGASSSPDQKEPQEFFKTIQAVIGGGAQGSGETTKVTDSDVQPGGGQVAGEKQQVPEGGKGGEPGKKN